LEAISKVLKRAKQEGMNSFGHTYKKNVDPDVTPDGAQV
jgi:hypothetical protein